MQAAPLCSHSIHQFPEFLNATSEEKRSEGKHSMSVFDAIKNKLLKAVLLL
jgi:hypothetical protein